MTMKGLEGMVMSYIYKAKGKFGRRLMCLFEEKVEIINYRVI